jgi:hypothetical protein
MLPAVPFVFGQSASCCGPIYPTLPTCPSLLLRDRGIHPVRRHYPEHTDPTLDPRSKPETTGYAPYTAVAGAEDLPAQPLDAFRAQHPPRSPQESAQDPNHIREKSAVGGMMDVGLHHRRVDPQLASTGDSKRSSEFDGTVDGRDAHPGSGVNTCHPAADVSSGEYGLNSLSSDLRVTQRWIGGTDVPVFALVGRKQSRDDRRA